MKSRNTKLLSGAMPLAVGSVISKFIGVLYRIPLTNVLGAEGMGMYQLVFPVFALFMILATSGIPTALSRIVAEKRSQGQETKKYLGLALAVLVGLSLLFSLLIFATSAFFAGLQGNAYVRYGYYVIAPSIVFIGVIAGMRGWFQGETYMLPTALSNIIEQTVKLAVGIGLSAALKPYGLTASVCGALAGVTASEIVASSYLVAVYAVRSKKHPSGERFLRVSKKEAVEVFRIAYPIAIVAVLLPLSSFADSFVIVNALKWGGVDTKIATAYYGLLSGPVTSLVNMPVVMIMSIAVAIVPSVAASRVGRDIDGVIYKSKLSVKTAYLIGVPSAVFMIIFAYPLLSIMYPSLEKEQLLISSRLLALTAPNIVLMSVTQIYVSLLQALDRTKSAVKSLFCAVCVKIILNLTLVKPLGIIGAGIANLALGAIALIATNLSFLHLTSLRQERSVALILSSGVLTMLAIIAPRQYLGNYILALIVGFVVCYIIYFWLVILFGTFDRNEFLSLPFGGVLSKLHRAIRFWEYG